MTAPTTPTTTETPKQHIAFHGSHDIAAKYLARVLHHYDADEIVQGFGFERDPDEPGRWLVCAIGCTLDDYTHARFPIEIGFPIELAYLIDAIHEGLPSPVFREWPADVLAAPRTGALLDMVWPRFAVWLLTKECPSESGKMVAALYGRRIVGDEPTSEEWRQAWVSARVASTMELGTRSASDAAGAARFASDVAQSNPWSAGSAADLAAMSVAERSTEASEKRASSFRRQADKLLKLLRDAPLAKKGAAR